MQLRRSDAVGRPGRDAEPTRRDHGRLRPADPDESRSVREHRGRREERGSGRATPPGQLTAELWFRWTSAAAFLAVAGYGVARLVAAHRAPAGYPGRHRVVDVAH